MPSVHSVPSGTHQSSWLWTSPATLGAPLRWSGAWGPAACWQRQSSSTADACSGAELLGCRGVVLLGRANGGAAFIFMCCISKGTPNMNQLLEPAGHASAKRAIATMPCLLTRSVQHLLSVTPELGDGHASPSNRCHSLLAGSQSSMGLVNCRHGPPSSCLQPCIIRLSPDIQV